MFHLLRFRSCFVAAALFVSVFPGVAVAADLLGTVTDPDGRAVPRAHVLLSHPISIAATTFTDAAGRFRFFDLDAGRYDVRVAVSGFRAEAVTVDLDADGTREITIQLRLSAITETVVVSAAQVDRPLSRTADSVTVIDADTLRSHQVETVSDALRLVPGLTVTQSGGRGGIASLFPRGGESNFTLVLIDGVRVNTFGGGFDFAHLPVADIERIEVVRGPQSALYGADAIGAVIQIVTRQGRPPRTEGVIEGGSFGTTRLTGSTAGSAGAWSWAAGGERLDTDGFTGLAPATGERVSNDDYRRHDASFSAGWRGARDTRVRGHVRLGSLERGFPGPIGRDPLGNVTAVDRIARGRNDSRIFSLDATYPWNARIRQHVQLSFADLDGAFTSRFGESESETTRLSIRAQADARVGPRVGVSVGFELQRERAASTFITGANSSQIPVRRRIFGAFGEARMTAADRVFVTTGLRVEYIHRDALEPDANAFAPRPPFDVHNVVSVNPKLSVAYFFQPTDRRTRWWTRVHGSVGTGIRPPDGFEIAFTDNPSLAPEHSRSTDIGIEQALGGGAFVIDGTAFFNRYDDLIVAVGRSLQDASRFRTDNISNARARGLELAASARSAWGLDVRVTYTWLVTEILAADAVSGQAPPPFAVGDPLLRRPRHQGAIDLTFTRGVVTAFGRFGARGRALDVEPTFGAFGGLFTVPGYGVVHAGTSVRAWRGIELFGRITNMLDHEYEETLGFPALGRSVVGGIRIAASR